MAKPKRKVVEVERIGALLCVRPGRRSGSWIWLNLDDLAQLPDVATVRDGEKRFLTIEATGLWRPAWRIVGPAE